MVLSWSFSVVSVAGTSRLFSYFDSITQVQKEINPAVDSPTGWQALSLDCRGHQALCSLIFFMP